MTDEELHREIYNLGAGLLNGQWPVLRAGFDRHGFDMNKHRYKRPIPTTVVGQVLTMSTDAYDAFGLTVIGLGKHATAAALGPIRFILESLAWLCWLLEDPDGQERRARAYGLAMNSIDGLRRVGEMLSRVTSKSSDTVQFDTRLAASTDRMKRELLALAEEDGVTIAPIPGSLSKLAEQYLSDHGGYLTYAMLNSAGAHPGLAHSFLFYGDPEIGAADFDFKRMFDRRAYWTAVAIRLYLDVCTLAAPVLGWPGWDATDAATRRRLEPLADEATKRYEEPWRKAMASMTDSTAAANPD